MSRLVDDTIGGFNSVLAREQKKEGEAPEVEKAVEKTVEEDDSLTAPALSKGDEKYIKDQRDRADNAEVRELNKIDDRADYNYKKMYDKIASGDPAVVVDKNLFDDTGKPVWTPFQANIKNEYIADNILADMRKIEAQFDTDIGIPNANTDKRERLITDEVNANNVETAIRCEFWLEQIKKAVEETNTMFGTTISVDWRVNPKTDIADNWTGGNNDAE